ncbi:MAG TPA: hypothetical protein VJA21_10430 [Verrucomicrobiae bacterium]
MKNFFRICLILGLQSLPFHAQCATNPPPEPALRLSADSIPATGAGESAAPFIAADGSRVVFTSAAANLVTNDFNDDLDVFAYDRFTGQLTLASVNAAGDRSGNGRSFALDLSANGRFVLFESEASDLVANDTNNVADLFIRDLVQGQTTLVSVDTNGVPAGPFYRASLSPDGRYLLFESFPRRLVTNAVSGCNIYLRDLQTGNTSLVSVSSDGLSGGNSTSENAVMTPDGRWVAFQSRASNLVTNDTSSNPDIFLRDTLSGTTVLVSATRNGSSVSTASAANPAISGDGRFVAFESTAASMMSTNPTPAGFTRFIYVRDMVAATTTCVSLAGENGVVYRPVISADGRYVAYESRVNVYCCDRSTLQWFLMSTNAAGAGGNDVSFSPAFTPDGAYCLFLSSARDLTADGTSLNQCHVYRRNMLTGEIQMIDNGGGAGGAFGGALAADITDDGETVAFASTQADPGSGDSNELPDVFVRNVTAGTNELISVRAQSLPALVGTARSWWWPNCVSSDGRYIAFYSAALNLVTNATRGVENLYVRDLWTGSNQLVNVALDGADCGNGFHYAPALSADGRWLAYQSSATNLVAGDINSSFDVFLYDLLTGTNRLVSFPWTRTGSANNSSLNPSISDDGRFIAFQSAASNLAAGDSGTTLDAFVYDAVQATNIPLSVRYNGTTCVGGQSTAGNGVLNPFAPIVTLDGQWVVLWSSINLSSNANLSGTPYCFAKHLSTGQFYPVGIPDQGLVRSANRSAVLSPGGRFAAFATASNVIGVFDFAAQSSSLAVTPGWNPSISADGRWVAFEGRAADFLTNSANSVSDIFLLDRATQTVRLVSVNRAGNAGGNGPSSTPLVSGDGHYIVFKSRAGDLVDGDTNGVADIFVADQLSGTLFALSSAVDAPTGNRVSGDPFLARDGRTVLFESFASNLAPGDFNQAKDLFILRLPGHPVGDFRILTLTSLQSGSVSIFWNALPGRRYRVEYQQALGEPAWQEVPGDVVATGYTAMKPDPGAGQSGSRLYRVHLLD